jgi:hypothetical protein
VRYLTRVSVVAVLLSMATTFPCEAGYYLADSGFSSLAGAVSSSSYGLVNATGMPLGGMSSRTYYLLVAGFARWGDMGFFTGVPDWSPSHFSYGFLMDQNYPNPFNALTRMRFSIPGRSGERVPTRVTVFDLLGRVVIVLLDEMVPSGPHEIGWDGSNARGHKVASGVYFIQARCGNLSAVKRVVLLR